MHREDVKLAAILRRALGRAGIVLGWDHICRRCKAEGRTPHTWRHADDEKRRCPACGMILWPKAVPPPIRWHDLRHTAPRFSFAMACRSSTSSASSGTPTPGPRSRSTGTSWRRISGTSSRSCPSLRFLTFP